MKDILFRRSLTYLLLVISFFITIILLYKNIHSDGYCTIYFNVIIDSMLLASPTLLCKKRRCMYVYLLLTILYILSIVWYYRTYNTIMPLSSYLLIENLDGLAPSIIHSIHLSDAILILPLCLYLSFYEWIYRKWIHTDHIKKTHQTIIYLSCLAFIMGATSIPYWPNKRPAYDQPLYLFKTEGTSAIKKYGIINHLIYQYTSLRPVSEEDKQYARNFIKQLHQNNNPLLINQHNKNLILILVESLQSWAINLKVEEEEVTPYMNKIIKDSTTLYFPKIVPQVKDGRSSDAQLIINTGLLPLSTGAASSLCATNTFPSLPSALKEKGYTSISFICDNRTFWNQGHTTIAYGFNYLYDQMQKDKKRKDADETLFQNALPLLKKEDAPFYAQLVTISSHEPYNTPIIADSPLNTKKITNVEAKNYLIAIQYVDRCIKHFIKGLKKEGLYDNSIIVITGDHEQMTFNNYEGRIQQTVEDCFVPFIIINSPLNSPNTNCNFGQVDIYTSLLDLMGCNNYFWKGLGESVFNHNVSNYATFRTKSATEGKNVSDSIKKYKNECWRVSDILLRMNYFKKSY